MLGQAALLKRDPVLSLMIPFLTALSMSDTVPGSSFFASSGVFRLLRSVRIALRRRERASRLRSVRTSVWRARFSAEK